MSERVLLLQLDGPLPNIALMRIAAHHRALGDEVELRVAQTESALGRDLWGATPDRVYASLIFSKTKPLAEALLRLRPDAIIGGTGWDIGSSLEAHGITTKEQDYSVYPRFRDSVGFSQIGCRLACGFCVVAEKEGKPRPNGTLGTIWRGPGTRRIVHLFDNDFLYDLDRARAIADEAKALGLSVSISQGVNVRLITDEGAALLASMDLRAVDGKSRHVYAAWDNLGEEERVMTGLRRLVAAGFKPEEITVYMLVGYVKKETEEDRLYRFRRLADFGALPFPMPFVRTVDLLGFARYVIKGLYRPLVCKKTKAVKRRAITWEEFKAVRYSVRRLRLNERTLPLFGAA
jgi:hypothetical protein